MVDFAVIKQKRVYEDIVGQVQALIQEGVLKPGDRLPPERELAERLGVSRSSLREAIRALELRGLVVSRPGAGTFVSTESVETILSVIAASINGSGGYLSDIFEVRHLLEPQIAALAAERATPEDIRSMASSLEEQARQIERGETGVEGDTAFHFAMAMATHNKSRFDSENKVFLDIVRKPPSNRCYFCHSTQDLQTPGTDEWVHNEDIHMTSGMSCSDCHRNGVDHMISRGDIEPSKTPHGSADYLKAYEPKKSYLLLLSGLPHGRPQRR